MNEAIPPVESQPSPEAVRFLEDRLYEYNAEQTGFDDGRWLSIFVRDDSGEIAAGLHGWTWGGACHVQTLWVRKDLRGHGYGSRLLATAEEEARARGCHRLSLETFGFQAPIFYQKQGYEIISTLDDVLPPHRVYRLRKNLRT